MYRKGISKLLIAGMLLSGIQLPGNTGVAGAERLEKLPVSAAGTSTSGAIVAGKAAFADMNQHWASPAVDRLAYRRNPAGEWAGKIWTKPCNLARRDSGYPGPCVSLLSSGNGCVQ